MRERDIESERGREREREKERETEKQREKVRNIARQSIYSVKTFLLSNQKGNIK